MDTVPFSPIHPRFIAPMKPFEYFLEYRIQVIERFVLARPLEFAVGREDHVRIVSARQRGVERVVISLSAHVVSGEHGIGIGVGECDRRRIAGRAGATRDAVSARGNPADDRRKTTARTVVPSPLCRRRTLPALHASVRTYFIIDRIIRR